MDVRFEDESGHIVLKATENIFIPSEGDLMLIGREEFRVNYRYIDYDKNILIIDIERE